LLEHNIAVAPMRARRAKVRACWRVRNRLILCARTRARTHTQAHADTHILTHRQTDQADGHTHTLTHHAHIHTPCLPFGWANVSSLLSPFDERSRRFRPNESTNSSTTIWSPRAEGQEAEGRQGPNGFSVLTSSPYLLFLFHTMSMSCTRAASL